MGTEDRSAAGPACDSLVDSFSPCTFYGVEEIVPGVSFVHCGASVLQPRDLKFAEPAGSLGSGD